MRITGLLILILTFFAHFAQAQDDEKPKTLIGKVKRVAAYGGTMLQFGQIAGEMGAFSGGGGALIFNRTFILGGYGIGLASTINKDFTVGGTMVNNARVNLGHGGFLLGGVIGSNNLVHLVLSSQVGFGNVRVEDNMGMYYEKKGIFVLSPQAEAEINVTSFMRISMGGGYRVVSGYSGSAFSNSDLGGAYGCLSLKFGWFN